MKNQDLTPALLSGKIMCVGTYLSGKIENLTVRDKANPGGPRRAAHMVREVVITESEPIVVTRWMKDDEKFEEWKPTAAKGSKVVVTITKMESNQGIITLSGSVEALV